MKWQPSRSAINELRSRPPKYGNVSSIDARLTNCCGLAMLTVCVCCMLNNAQQQQVLTGC